MGDVALRAGEKVIHAKHVMAVADEPVAKVRAEKTRAASYKDTLCHLHSSMVPKYGGWPVTCD
jgi:hypothetical protein